MSEELGAYLRRLEDRAARLQKELDRTATLRDQFAMAALTGLLANPKLTPTILKHGASWFDENAWAYADAMMEKRK